MASLRKINDRYYIVFRDESGKQRSRAIGKLNKRQAERELFLYENSQSSPSSITFHEFCFEYVKWHGFEYPASHKRVRQILEQHVIPFFGHLSLDSITIQRGEEYKRDRSFVVSKGTVIKEIRTLKAVLNKAVEWGRLDRNPLAALKPPKETRSDSPPFYTREQMEMLYSVSSTYDAAVWRFLANTGLRRAEIMQLKVTDIRKNGIYVISRAGARTKSGKFRVVPWADGAKEAMPILLERAGDYLMERINPRSLSRRFEKALERAGLIGSIHWLRHTFGSHLVMSEVPMRVIQKVMGHSTISVTERYAHLSDEYAQHQIGALVI